MGGTPAPEALAVHIQTYCTLSTLSDEAEAALEGVLASLHAGGEQHLGVGGAPGLVQLIQAGGEVLTSTDDSIRNRGTMLMSEALKRLPALLSCQPPAAVATLLTFFASRLKDEPCVREVLRGARHVADAVQPGLGDDVERAMVELVSGIFEHVHVQSLSLSDRHNAYQIVYTAVVRLDFSPALLGDKVLMGFVGIMDGERDPRNLRLCFSIIPTVAQRHLSSTEEADALFAVFSCYFPITFTPPPNDTVGITSEMLREGLLACMTSHLLMATHALDLAQVRGSLAPGLGLRV